MQLLYPARQFSTIGSPATLNNFSCNLMTKGVREANENHLLLSPEYLTRTVDISSNRMERTLLQLDMEANCELLSSTISFEGKPVTQFHPPHGQK
jgi:hypothetical protein